ncbi:MAG: hypothetical protein K0R31_347 [Clostridiales bacterium]|nr:hypothetical protein [Clostridiales bacterium]
MYKRETTNGWEHVTDKKILQFKIKDIRFGEKLNDTLVTCHSAFRTCQ